MGCASSKAEDRKVEASRRRLSVGHVDPNSDGGPAEATEEDRQLIATLNEEALAEMMKGGDRKFSIGSATDDNKKSFANKTNKIEGDAGQIVGLGYTCRKGLKPESPNQDSFTVLNVNGEWSMFGVFDGHGQKGHDVSNFVKDNLPKLILRDQKFRTEDMAAGLKDQFKKMQNLIATASRTKKLSAEMSGTTCSIAFHDTVKGELTVAHVADSTIVMGKRKGDKLVGTKLTRDHKPDLPDERKRIEASGGRVVFDGYANHRVYAKNGRYPGLNMSRCMGDLLGHSDAGCSAEPEVNTIKLEPDDEVLLVCSDGVWEFLEPDAALAYVNNPPAKAQSSADALAKAAWDRWIQEEGGQVVDDITVILIYLQEFNKKSA
jgi:serine/threonine protein phosphatase PrpC